MRAIPDAAAVRRLLDETPVRRTDEWTGALVGTRLIAAFEVLGRLPGGVGPAGVASNLAKYAGLFHEEVDPDEVEEETRRRFAWSRARPSPREVSAMERAFEWPIRYFAADEEACRCLLAWALAKAQRRKLDRVVARLGLDRDRFDAARRRAAYGIAVALARRRVPLD